MSRKAVTRRDHWQGMNWIRQEKRLAIYLRDGMCCVYCGTSVEAGAILTLDHVKAHSKGGSNAESNLVTACKTCNSSRGTRSMPRFAEAVSNYVSHGLSAAQIIKYIRATTKRRLPLARAKELIDFRGSTAKVVEQYTGEDYGPHC